MMGKPPLLNFRPTYCWYEGATSVLPKATMKTGNPSGTAKPPWEQSHTAALMSVRLDEDNF